MPGKSRKTRNSGRRGNSSGPRVIQTRNMIESSEAQLASRSDEITFRAKHLLTFNTASGLVGLPMTPTFLGGMTGALATVYSRFRILKLVFRVSPATSTTVINNAPFATGIMDDNSGEGGSVPDPTSMTGIMALRCSSLNTSSDDTYFKWNPLDPAKWYYSTSGSSGDNRLVVPGSFYISALPTGYTAYIEMHMTVQFAGASSATLG